MEAALAQLRFRSKCLAKVDSRLGLLGPSAHGRRGCVMKYRTCSNRLRGCAHHSSATNLAVVLANLMFSGLFLGLALYFKAQDWAPVPRVGLPLGIAALAAPPATRRHFQAARVRTARHRRATNLPAVEEAHPGSRRGDRAWCRRFVDHRSPRLATSGLATQRLLLGTAGMPARALR